MCDESQSLKAHSTPVTTHFPNERRALDIDIQYSTTETLEREAFCGYIIPSILQLFHNGNIPHEEFLSVPNAVLQLQNHTSEQLGCYRIGKINDESMDQFIEIHVDVIGKMYFLLI